MDFKNFDQRNYPFVTPSAGYGEWAETYEVSVPDLLDIGILNRIRSVDWPRTGSCLELACGTGRIGRWLSGQGAGPIDGIDLTPRMLDQAREKRIYRELREGSVEKTGFGSASYGLVLMSLADEHLARLGPVYAEAARLAAPGGHFVVVGMHPFFFMQGMPTHFEGSDGSPRAIETHVHLFSDHFEAAKAAGWELVEAIEGLIDDEWIREKPKWERFRNHPVNYGYVWSLR